MTPTLCDGCGEYTRDCTCPPKRSHDDGAFDALLAAWTDPRNVVATLDHLFGQGWVLVKARA